MVVGFKNPRMWIFRGCQTDKGDCSTIYQIRNTDAYNARDLMQMAIILLEERRNL